METGHFDSELFQYNSFWYEQNNTNNMNNTSSEISQKVWSLQKKFAFEQEKHLGEYFSFFKSSKWNYLLVHTWT